MHDPQGPGPGSLMAETNGRIVPHYGTGKRSQLIRYVLCVHMRVSMPETRK